MQVNIAEIKTQLNYMISDLNSVKVAIKAADVKPPVIISNSEITEHAFPGWLGVPVSAVSSASYLLNKYRPRVGRFGFTQKTLIF